MNKGGKENDMFGLKVQVKNLKTSVDSGESSIIWKHLILSISINNILNLETVTNKMSEIVYHGIFLLEWVT